jgi:DNA replication and repair protein RecF
VDLPLVRTGAASAFVRGEVESGGSRFLIEVEVRGSGQNRIRLNRSAVRRRRDVRRHAPAVFAGPDDLEIVQGDPAHRRRFMDEAVRSLWPLKEGEATAYERVLRQRNRLLKDWDGSGSGPGGLAGWDGELVTRGSAVTRLRGAAMERLVDAAADGFRRQTGDVMQVAYRPSVEVGGHAPLSEAEPEGLFPVVPPVARDPLEEAFAARLAERRQDELTRRTTLVGPHRDELVLEVQGLAARGFASHGETWGAALSLRLAQAEAVAAEVGEEPARFLDDPFAGLDPERRNRLGALLSARGQTFLALPDEAQVPPRATVWRVKEGSVGPE